MGSLIEAVKISDPDEVYNMAAVSYVATAFEQPVGNAEITGTAVTKLLEAIRFFNPKIKFYQASSSEMYGNGGNRLQKENTPFSPASPYAAAKLYAHGITDVYKKAYNMFAVSGILFNHESPLRGMEFVSRKITNGVAKIVLGLEKELVLGNLNAKRDWGYAPEYMEAIHLMLQNKTPESYVISTKEAHSVKEFVELSFEEVGLDWNKYVKTDKKFLRPLEVNYLCGDNSKAKAELNWKPKTKFKELVKIMVKEDLKRWKKFLDGEFFPWDAPMYPSEAKISGRQVKKINLK
jgi:GDPmannose 4,6-dehydratase